ncbi:hypothetical protein QLH51_16710 [Sphingomonas sp. 2R-10]|uniref:CC_3452 family protein n=1 Tax=Sphingomonas sp. 2R-10 TaxID=3045148 RepID=UPI000F774E0F|nr:hypothetical protein [Sphingomonas sp. 2R-10]MDJ0278440.1 hypothetical protein [Sphingomonas sp. 2R-10]
MKMLALFAAATMTLSFGAAAQSRGFTATPATAPGVASITTRDTLWKCAGDRCVTPRADGSHLTMCQLAAKELGVLTAFTANGEAFAPEQLARCNVRARGA